MKLRTRPKYYYRSFAVIYILIFLWILYSAINGLPNGWFFVILMAFVSVYWIPKAWKEWDKEKLDKEIGNMVELLKNPKFPKILKRYNKENEKK